MVEKKRLGEVLIEAGLISKTQLNAALLHQRQWGGRIGASLVRLGYLSEKRLVEFLSQRFGVASIDLAAFTVPPEIIGLVPVEVAKKYGVLPLQRSPDSRRLVVAMGDPANLKLIDELQFILSTQITPLIASDNALEKAIRFYYDRGTDFSPSPRRSTEIDLLQRAAGEQWSGFPPDAIDIVFDDDIPVDQAIAAARSEREILAHESPGADSARGQRPPFPVNTARDPAAPARASASAARPDTLAPDQPTTDPLVPTDAFGGRSQHGAAGDRRPQLGEAARLLAALIGLLEKEGLLTREELRALLR